MKKIFLLVGLFMAGCFQSNGQVKNRSYRNFPVIISLQFHSLSLPFKNLRSNFSNVGFGLGTEVSFNGSQNWVQQFNVVWYRNRNIGNGLLFNTETVWRPTIFDNSFSEIKAGAGFNYSFRPVVSFKPENENWMSVGHKGKGMLAVLGGISAGYNKYSSGTYVSPFVSYQMMLLKGYSKSIPIVPETLLQAGSRIHF